MKFYSDGFIEKERLRNDPAEMPVILVCNACSKEIYFNEFYYETEDGNFCEHCFDAIQSLQKNSAERVAGWEEDI